MNTSRRADILLIVSFVLLIVTYCLLQPRISGFFPFIRSCRLNSFLTQTKKDKTINPQEFWKLREFYYPGVIQFTKENIAIQKSFLIFKSKKIVSQESLISTSQQCNQVIPYKKKWTVLYQSQNEMIAQHSNLIVIAFCKSISEMSTANGFFDYKDKDKKILEGKKWYVYTEMKY